MHFGCGPGLDGGQGVVGAVEVPGVEAGEVLDRAEDFVAADCGKEKKFVLVSLSQKARSDRIAFSKCKVMYLLLRRSEGNGPRRDDR